MENPKQVNLRWIQKAERIVRSRISAYLFPELCIICDSKRNATHEWFCDTCIDKLRENANSRNACVKCGLNPDIRDCTCMIAWDFPFDRIYSIFDYNEHTQTLIQNIKYHGKKNLSRDLAMFLPDKTLFRNQFDIIVPVPLHWTRYRKRGYNQAEWFAKGIAAECGLPVLANVVKRSRSTGTQTALDKSERSSNIRNAFKVKKEFLYKVDKKRVLLVDDVVTTGATISECTNSLLDAGCKSVSVISIARD